MNLLLTALGEEAMSNSSVLEPARLGELLEALSAADRTRAIEGLELLATAALKTQRSKS